MATVPRAPQSARRADRDAPARINEVHRLRAQHRAEAVLGEGRREPQHQGGARRPARRRGALALDLCAEKTENCI